MDGKTKTYRIEGLSCTNCAKTFENNVKNLEGVIDAEVNFGAAKLTVTGHTTIEELEKAGAFDNLKIRDERKRPVERVPVWKAKENRKVYLSAVIFAASWLLSRIYGAGHLIPTAGYGLAMVIGGYSLFLTGLKNLIRLHFDMHTLMTIAIIGAALIGEWGEGAAVVILFAISEALERYSMDRARSSIRSLMSLSPEEALIRRDGRELTVPVEEVKPGDIMLVKPGQKLALDGVVTKGRSPVDESSITGESFPVVKQEGDEVFAGTLNKEGYLEVRVMKRAEETTLAKIIHLVEEAQNEKAPAQKFVDRFARYYTPAILIFAFCLAVIPPLVWKADWGEWIYRGLAVLVVGCPCALVVSTPVAIVTAIGNAAKNGVLIKGGVYLEELAHIKTVAFDKTGTLTKGSPVVTDIVSFGNRKAEKILKAAAALEAHSEHPVAAAIVKKAEEEGVRYRSLPVDDFQSVTGSGVKGKINGKPFRIGKPEFFPASVSKVPPVTEHVNRLEDEGKTVVLLGSDSGIYGLFAIRDELRSGTKEMIAKLYDAGIEQTVMLTGDHERTARAIGKNAGIQTVQAGLMPEEKLDFIRKLKQKYGKVAMVGDGVNDAPALAAATTGIAMGKAGTDAALETADIALMSDDLEKLPYLIKLSRKTLSIIKQNITFSLAVKLIALLLAFPGWLTLWIAIFADMGATLIVTLNSLRLIGKNI